MTTFCAAFFRYLIVTYPTQLTSFIQTLPTSLFQNRLLTALIFVSIFFLIFKKLNFFPKVKKEVNELDDKNCQKQKTFKFVTNFGLTLVLECVNISQSKLDVNEVR